MEVSAASDSPICPGGVFVFVFVALPLCFFIESNPGKNSKVRAWTIGDVLFRMQGPTKKQGAKASSPETGLLKRSRFEKWLLGTNGTISLDPGRKEGRYIKKVSAYCVVCMYAWQKERDRGKNKKKGKKKEKTRFSQHISYSQNISRHIRQLPMCYLRWGAVKRQFQPMHAAHRPPPMDLSDQGKMRISKSRNFRGKWMNDK